LKVKKKEVNRWSSAEKPPVTEHVFENRTKVG